MSRGGQIVVATTAWLGGLWLASQWLVRIPTGIGLVFALVSLAALILLRSRLGYVTVATAFLTLALLRGQAYFIDRASLSTDSLIGHKVTITGRVTSEPHWNDDRLHEYYLTEIGLDGHSVPGLLKVKSLVGNVREGQRITASGKVGRALGRAPAQIWYADVTVIDARPPFPIRLKNTLSRGLDQALPRDQAGFVRGLLFGSSATLAPADEANLKTAGLTHIIAVSGYNLTIIVATLTVFLRRRSKLGVLAVTAGIGFFVIMTGAPASIVRAAVMSGVFLLVAYYRREVDPRVALALTALAMTAWDPSYLYADIGWQLSILALAGVLCLGPALHPRIVRRHELAWDVFASSLGAYLATAPLIAYYFGTISLVAPVANLFILPLMPFIMFAGFVASLAGVIMPLSAFTLMQPVSWMVGLVLQAITAFAHVPSASRPIVLGVSATLAGYLVLCALAIFSLRRPLKRPSKIV